MKKVDNPPNRFDAWSREFLEEPPTAALEIFEEEAKSILSENKSPDLDFRWSLNPYRGCFHACSYCYARPSHEYLGFGAGTDFESKIVVKTNAAPLLRQTFEKSSWQGELILFSGDTDCYQPLERHYQLTRQCLQICLEYRNPVSLITKSPLIVRDGELIAQLSKQSYAHVTASIAFADDEMARRVEPQAPKPSRRFEMIAELAEKGIYVSVLIAPVIPGLNEAQIAQVLQRAKDAGAQSAGLVILRLPGAVKEVFLGRMQKEFPDRYKKIESFIRNARGGRLYNPSFHERYKGHGQYWRMIEELFKFEVKRLDLNHAPSTIPNTFKRPSELPFF